MEEEKLKTLKEIAGNMGDASYFFRGNEEPTNEWEGRVVIVNDLKAEAVKWVNNLDKRISVGIAYNFSKSLISWTAQSSFIMEFFNLTEEDLI